MAKHIHIHVGGKKTKDSRKEEMIAYVKSKIEAANNELARGRLDPGSHSKEVEKLEAELHRLISTSDEVACKDGAEAPSSSAIEKAKEIRAKLNAINLELHDLRMTEQHSTAVEPIDAAMRAVSTAYLKLIQIK